MKYIYDESSGTLIDDDSIRDRTDDEGHVIMLSGTRNSLRVCAS